MGEKLNLKKISFNMSLQDVLVDTLWTPYVEEVINDNVEYESIYYHFTDESTLIPGYSAWARSFIADVDAAIDLDFVETSDINISTIDFIVRDQSWADGSILGLTSIYSSWIEAETYLSTSQTSDSNYNTFIHELGHALGLGEPGYDSRWDQDDTSMSYNPSNGDEFNKEYTDNDWDALITIWGSEDFIKYGDSLGNILKAQSGKTHKDSIFGFGGNDLIYGYGGKDSIYGGVGNDTIYGGYGGDILKGLDGDDIIYASHGSDYILAGSGNDNIFAGQGADTIFGGAGADTIRGGGGPNDIDVGDNDGSQDLVYIFSDVDTNDRPDDGSFIDLIENVEEIDRIYIMGNRSTDHLDFVDQGDFIDIYHNDAHEVRLLDTELTAGQVKDITSFF